MKSSGQTWDSADSTHLPCLISAQNCIFYAWDRRTRISHDLWILDYSLNEWGLCRVGSVHAPWQRRPRGVAHLYPPRTVYWTDARDMLPLRSVYMAFRDGERAGLNQVLGKYTHRRFVDPDGVLCSLLLEAADTNDEEHQSGWWHAQSCLIRTIGLLLQAEPDADGCSIISQPTPSSSSDFLSTVRNYLREHMAEPVTLADLAGHVHMSISGLCHRYRRETGEAPMQTLMRIRLDQVKSLLLRGLPLKVIAAQTAFCDVYHLSKAFKKSEGIPPTTFARRAAGME